jgi:hypothetical protein
MKIRVAVLQQRCRQDTSFMKIGPVKFNFLCVNEFIPAFLKRNDQFFLRFGAENLNTVPRESCEFRKNRWGGGGGGKAKHYF